MLVREPPGRTLRQGQAPDLVLPELASPQIEEKAVREKARKEPNVGLASGLTMRVWQVRVSMLLKMEAGRDQR